MTTGDDCEAFDEPPASKSRKGRPKVTRSPTPEEFLPTRTVRVFLKVNGKPVKGSKVIKCNFNIEFDEFTDFVHPLLYKKANVEYNPMGFKELTLKYGFFPQARLTKLAREPFLEQEFNDLDDENDYESLQSDLAYVKREMVMVYQAAIVTPDASPRTAQVQPIDANVNEESNRNEVSFPFFIVY